MLYRVLYPLLLISFSPISSASYDKKFEELMLSTSIILNENYTEPSFCVFCKDDYLIATKDNFSLTLNNIQRIADNCITGQDNAEKESFAWHMEMQFDPEYSSSSYELSEKLINYFKAYPSQELDCELMTKTLMEEETLHLNHQQYNSFVAKQCQPIVTLRNCLIDRTYTGRTIYNDLRKLEGKMRIRSSKGLEKEYKATISPN